MSQLKGKIVQVSGPVVDVEFRSNDFSRNIIEIFPKKSYKTWNIWFISNYDISN